MSGYAGRQLDTLPYLTLYALLSGPLTEHNTKVLLIIRRTVQAIIADYKFANRVRPRPYYVGVWCAFG